MFVKLNDMIVRCQLGRLEGWRAIEGYGSHPRPFCL